MAEKFERGRRVLVVGVPRSGTTWVAQVLGSCEDTALMIEPDNPMMHPFALHKRTLPGGYYSQLKEGADAPHLERLWRSAFGLIPTGRNSEIDHARRRLSGALHRRVPKSVIREVFTPEPRLSKILRAAETLSLPVRPPTVTNVVAKSVQAALCTEWIAEQVDAQVVIVRRHPRNLISSWVEMDWIGAGPHNELHVADPARLRHIGRDLGIAEPPVDALERTAWLLAMLERSLMDAAARHPQWIVLEHDALCADPSTRFRELAQRLGLRWCRAADQFLVESNRAGRGYTTQRIAADSREVWRRRLSEDEAERVCAIYFAIGART